MREPYPSTPIRCPHSPNVFLTQEDLTHVRDALSECEARCSVLGDRLRTIDEEKEEEPLPPFSIDDPVCV